ncbi:contractile injection system tape measure protein [Maridesulfovibrio sp.]|uniref:contractile injection system tape measure protein n=1 Tax=Maridesulfovibrio sp. TaxID=2795000 RepID=UPI0039F11A04
MADHALHTVSVALEVEQGLDSSYLQQRIAGICRELIGPAVEAGVDSFDSGRVLRIDQLELSLGMFNPDFSDHDFIDRFSEQLAGVLKELEWGAVGGELPEAFLATEFSVEVSNGTADSAKFLPIPEREAEVVRHYLSFGILPWYSSAMSTDELRRLVLGVFATDDVTRKWFVDIGSASPGPGQRMVNLLDCEGLVSISSMLKSYRYVTSANVFWNEEEQAQLIRILLPYCADSASKLILWNWLSGFGDISHSSQLKLTQQYGGQFSSSLDHKSSRIQDLVEFCAQAGNVNSSELYGRLFDSFAPSSPLRRLIFETAVERFRANGLEDGLSADGLPVEPAMGGVENIPDRNVCSHDNTHEYSQLAQMSSVLASAQLGCEELQYDNSDRREFAARLLFNESLSMGSPDALLTYLRTGVWHSPSNAQSSCASYSALKSPMGNDLGHMVLEFCSERPGFARRLIALSCQFPIIIERLDMQLDSNVFSNVVRMLTHYMREWLAEYVEQGEKISPLAVRYISALDSRVADINKYQAYALLACAPFAYLSPLLADYADSYAAYMKEFVDDPSMESQNDSSASHDHYVGTEPGVDVLRTDLEFLFRTMLGGDDQGVDGRIDYASFTEAFLRVAGESESFALIALQSGNSPSLKNVLGSCGDRIRFTLWTLLVQFVPSDILLNVLAGETGSFLSRLDKSERKWLSECFAIIMESSDAALSAESRGAVMWQALWVGCLSNPPLLDRMERKLFLLSLLLNAVGENVCQWKHSAEFLLTDSGPSALPISSKDGHASVLELLSTVHPESMLSMELAKAGLSSVSLSSDASCSAGRKLVQLSKVFDGIFEPFLSDVHECCQNFLQEKVERLYGSAKEFQLLLPGSSVESVSVFERVESEGDEGENELLKNSVFFTFQHADQHVSEFWRSMAIAVSSAHELLSAKQDRNTRLQHWNQFLESSLNVESQEDGLVRLSLQGASSIVKFMFMRLFSAALEESIINDSASSAVADMVQSMAQFFTEGDWLEFQRTVSPEAVELLAVLTGGQVFPSGAENGRQIESDIGEFKNDHAGEAVYSVTEVSRELLSICSFFEEITEPFHSDVLSACTEFLPELVQRHGLFSSRFVLFSPTSSIPQGSINGGFSGTDRDAEEEIHSCHSSIGLHLDRLVQPAQELVRDIACALDTSHRILETHYSRIERVRDWKVFLESILISEVQEPRTVYITMHTAPPSIKLQFRELFAAALEEGAHNYPASSVMVDLVQAMDRLFTDSEWSEFEKTASPEAVEVLSQFAKEGGWLLNGVENPPGVFHTGDSTEVQNFKNDRSSQFTEISQKVLASVEDLSLADEPDSFVVRNAGIALIASFLPHVFRENDLLIKQGGKEFFKDDFAQNQALLISQALVTGELESPEHDLMINKLLCGIPWRQPVPFTAELTPEHLVRAESVMEKCLRSNWAKLEKSSYRAIRDGFLKRDGLLYREPGRWLLRVERTPLDVMIDFVPWPISMCKFSWMKTMLQVEW